jgi:hypothetical protein
VCLSCLLVTLANARASAQNFWVSGAVQRDVQRFSDNDATARLDGSATGWTIGGAALVSRHVAFAVEWSDAGTITDAETFTLEFAGRPLAITSTFSHRTRALVALGGFGHSLVSRVTLAYLIGAAFTSVRRDFTSDAPGLVLVPPSDRATPGSSTVTDRNTGLAAGLDTRIRIVRHVHAALGARVQRIHLSPDASGWSVRMVAGAGWTF